MKRKRKRTQINKTINERGQLSPEFAEIEKIVRKYYEQLSANKLDNLEKIDACLETYNLTRLSQKHKI